MTAREQYELLFTAVFDEEDTCSLEMESRQMKDFVLCLNSILRPKITYSANEYKMYKEIAHRNMIAAYFLLQHVKMALPDGHRLLRTIGKIESNVAPAFGEQFEESKGGYLDRLKEKYSLIA